MGIFKKQAKTKIHEHKFCHKMALSILQALVASFPAVINMSLDYRLLSSLLLSWPWEITDTPLEAE